MSLGSLFGQYVNPFSTKAMRQHLINQQMQWGTSTLTFDNLSLTTGTTSNHFTISNGPALTIRTEEHTNRAWLDKRVNELRVKL